MLEQILKQKGFSARAKIGIKGIVFATALFLCIALPQWTHLLLGPSGGILLLPMYFPVLLSACLCGMRFGLAVALIAPLSSYFLTSMPTENRLPFLIIELCVFAVVCGAFSNRILQRPNLSLPVVLLAQGIGRALFLLCVFCFQKQSDLSPRLIASQILVSIPALLLQATLICLISRCISKKSEDIL